MQADRCFIFMKCTGIGDDRSFGKGTESQHGSSSIRLVEDSLVKIKQKLSSRALLTLLPSSTRSNDPIYNCALWSRSSPESEKRW